MNQLTCFKAYDVRGVLGDELNDEIAYRIGRAYTQHLNANRIVIGCDIRHTSKPLKHSLAQGIMDSGADVIDIGITGTEEVYFATFHLGVDGGIEVTASHNPIDYNGMKFVKHGAHPISSESGLLAIQQLAEKNSFTAVADKGNISRYDILHEYIEHLLSYISLEALTPLSIVVNAGNGAAGHVLDAMEEIFFKNRVPIEFIKINHEPDSRFPNGIPNPLLKENRKATAQAVREHNADLGIAWDGDFDRCFLFDEAGQFIEGYYIVGLLAEAFLNKRPGEKIIHDPRLTWNTIDIVHNSNGIPIQSKTGHAFIKERMRAENAIYGGEMSAHHYFRDFAYCDSGMIPWLLVIERLCNSGQPLSSLIAKQQAAYPCSGEINFHVKNIPLTLTRIYQHFKSQQPLIDETDGISMSFKSWRMNVRASNTEPLLRLNIETRGDSAELKLRVRELEGLILAGA